MNTEHVSAQDILCPLASDIYLHFEMVFDLPYSFVESGHDLLRTPRVTRQQVPARPCRQ